MSITLNSEKLPSSKTVRNASLLNNQPYSKQIKVSCNCLLLHGIQKINKYVT